MSHADFECDHDLPEAPFQRALSEESLAILATVVDEEDRDLPYRVYRGDALPGLDCRVRMVENNVSRILSHYGYHSSRGFSWGYGGIGPTELALNVLADYFGEHDALTLEQIKTSRKAWHKYRALRTVARGQLYQIFKEEVIARFDEFQPWRLTENNLRYWLAQFPELLLDACVQCGAIISEVQHRCGQCGDPLCEACGTDEKTIGVCDECFDQK